MNLADDPVSGHVGGPTACVEFKIIDVPEMIYYTTDFDINGYPIPRGEICLRCPSTF
jgi:long-chain acyl-CoA synthetase